MGVSIFAAKVMDKQRRKVAFQGSWNFRHYESVSKVNKVNSRFKKDLKLQIHLHKTFFFDDGFLDSLHKSFLNQTTLDLRKEKWTFLNREFTVPS